MKNKILKTAGFLIAAALSLTGLAHAANPLVNETGLGYNQTYPLNMKQTDRAAFQAVYSSASPAAVTFVDGIRSTSSITVSVNTNLAAVKATETITVTATANLAGAGATNSLTVVSTGGIVGNYFTLNGSVYRAGSEFAIAATSTGTAENIKAAINANTLAVIATRGGSVVFTTATPVGNTGNAYTLTSSTPAALTAGAATFSGGRAPALQNAVLTINGIPYREGVQWAAGLTSTETATSIRVLLSHIDGISVSTTQANSVITASATTAGTAANAYTVTASTTALTIGNATFTNGRDNAVVTINGTSLTQGTAWTAAATSSGTAKAISDAIQLNATLAAIVSSTWSAAGVVTTTATVVGTAGNYAITATPTLSLVVPRATYTGGTASDVNTTTYSIGKANLFGNGLQVLYTNTAGTNPANLVAGTTYFVMYTDANNFKLASTSALAKAGTAIVISSTNASGGGTFVLTPLAIAGTPSFKWQVSNDGTNWTDYSTTSNNVTVSSVTVASYTAGGASTVWDFGAFGFSWIRLSIVSPTAGGLNIVVTPGKDD